MTRQALLTNGGGCTCTAMPETGCNLQSRSLHVDMEVSNGLESNIIRIVPREGAVSRTALFNSFSVLLFLATTCPCTHSLYLLESLDLLTVVTYNSRRHQFSRFAVAQDQDVSLSPASYTNPQSRPSSPFVAAGSGCASFGSRH